MKKSIVSKIISVILIIILITGTILIFLLPKLFDMFKSPNVSPFGEHTIIYRIAFYMCYILCLMIVYKLIRLFDIVYKGNPFKKEVSNILKFNSFIFLLLFIIVMIKSIFIPTLLSFAVALVVLVAGLSFYVLSDVITSAIEYKKEVDLTV